MYARVGLHHKRFIWVWQLHRDAIAELVLELGEGHLQHYRGRHLEFQHLLVQWLSVLCEVWFQASIVVSQAEE